MLVRVLGVCDRQRPSGLRALVRHQSTSGPKPLHHCVRNLLKPAPAPFFPPRQVIANNTQPATLAWKLPDEQLLEVTMTLRL